MRLIPALFNSVGKWSKQYANLPDRYINRMMKETDPRPRGKQYYKPPRILQKTKKFTYGLARPWTSDGKISQIKGFVPVEPLKDWNYFPGDRVEILEGKDKGKQGTIYEVYEERNWVLVRGRNLKLTPTGHPDPSLMFTEKEQPLLVTTDISLIDPYDRKPTQIEWRYTEAGERVRVSIRTGKIIPMPPQAFQTKDYKKPELYVEQDKDTTANDVEMVTFKPELKTFEMDIMDKMGIKEDRVPRKYYWY